MCRQLLLLLATLGLTQCSSRSSCPPLFTEIEGVCYFFSSTIGAKANWYNAQAACQKLGTEHGVRIGLAEIGRYSGCASPDVELMKTVSDMRQPVWLGTSDSASEGTWVWQHSRQILSIHSNMWYYTEPDSGPTVNCLTGWIYAPYRNRAYLADLQCTHVQHYVCQKFT
ncbi:unnamed protein product [Meganyctiphanes norvegica]|uniref:C-type lectin domain-containing protein n=1 Tax=Meganyctiphanes norvegica TaxID=48144 RepID=A0AAV2RWI5_MEGNR